MDTTATFWLPVSASTVAPDIDSLWGFVFWMSTFFFLLIVGMMVVFAIRYRRRAGDLENLDKGPSHNSMLEAAWIIIPTLLVIVIFIWGFRGFMRLSVVPANAMEVTVTGQKWFWSFSYPEGASTVNDLVVPVDQPVKLLMSSQDVIHSFFVPAFRIKRDVLPNRYQVAWFEATQVGEYDLFCTEYCGTSHSEMIGKVRVLTRADYNTWLEESTLGAEGMDPVELGRRLYVSKACITCHTIDGTPNNGPSFLGVFGHQVELANGTSVTADENYLRESILSPMSKVVAGYQPIMPTYQGLLKDAELDALVAYIKSLGAERE